MALAGPGSTAWVLADEAPERTLGPALVWADREGVEELHVIVDGPADAAATVARQAGLFAPRPRRCGRFLCRPKADAITGRRAGVGPDGPRWFPRPPHRRFASPTRRRPRSWWTC